MTAFADPPRPAPLSSTDHFVFLGGVSWEDYEQVVRIRGDRSAPRISFLEGTVELLSPGENHELVKSNLGRLVEAWCLHHGIRFRVRGSWTIKDESVARAVEPDECYLFGDDPQPPPHLAIEVVWTSGGLDKLEIYRKLGVREVWVWKRGQLSVNVLRGERYAVVATSEVLPGIDLGRLAHYAEYADTFEAITSYRAEID